MLILWGCGKGDSTDNTLTAALQHIWEPEGFYPAYAMSSVNYDDGAVIYAWLGEGQGGFIFVDYKDGSEKNMMYMEQGNGPGELAGFQAVDVRDGIMTIFDNTQGKLIVYEAMGEHIDDYALNMDI